MPDCEGVQYKMTETKRSCASGLNTVIDVMRCDSFSDNFIDFVFLSVWYMDIQMFHTRRGIPIMPTKHIWDCGIIIIIIMGISVHGNTVSLLERNYDLPKISFLPYRT